MKIILTTFVLFIGSWCFGQTGSLKGIVTDNTGKTLSGVNVILNNTALGTQTNPDGIFEFEELQAGDYTLSLSYLGFRTKNLEINLNASQTLDLGNITLYEGNEILNEVVIEGTRRNKFSRRKTAYVAKLPLKDLENTQVYSTITNELLQSQVVTNFDDALKNATGVEKLWASTGRGGDGAGYYALRGFSVQPQLVNGLPGLTNGTINPANIERIEVLKGPSATLFGNAISSYGGLINVVTKKPYLGTGGEVAFTSGSYGLNQIVGDFNTPLSKENDLYFRLNTAYTTEQSFQDAGFRESFFVAPSLSYRVNNRLSFSFYGEITKAEQTNPTFLFSNRSAPTEASNLEELGYNNKLSFTSNNLSLKNPTQNYRLEMDYKLSDAWQSQTLLSKSTTSTTGYYSYLFDYGILEGNTYSRLINKQNANTQTTDIQQNFTGDFKTGTFRNRVVVGLDYFNETQTDNSTGYVFFGNIKPNGEQASLDNPLTADVVESKTFPLSSAAVDAALANAGVSNAKSSYSIFSAYASDVIDFTDFFSVMLGLRLDHFDNQGSFLDPDDGYNQTTLSPKAGVVFQPIKDELAVFANYQNGFTNVAPQLVGNPEDGPQTLKTFDPEQANQIEFGIKTNLFNNRLNATLSYYDITVTDRVITDPDSPFNRIQGGEVVSRGFEFEVNVNPLDGLNMRLGYSYNDSETTKSDNANILNKRPLEAGPKNLYNFWSSYEFQQGQLDGFGIGFGFNGASERFAINYANTGDFILPSYTIANASVFYQAKHYRVSLKLNNAFNKEYYKGWTTINPQQPRALLANISYTF
ncbi:MULTISPECIES: TonB-dependent receptor [unclassified Leeuwenhoekiella]|uniref:TonB-dependent receptor n=1 Tax=unclassified Leeuwenhoekiella TaxID=2615029 RepID=UPI000C65BA0A|nr:MULTISPECIES: TonB-dependent receptor [unclassified Leeuwenhoekiella]MAW95460.1 TonB-dependent siderophore receptor [Leeuwenhoekiella sp.]MBA80847.1 TonB-dependent siderophore receptor [Leeuwenhoekiella sp.]|tara:strand:- start:5659 stop:8085 length:2427 start_codon:yes stop_codon:yes gene_type:complete